MASGKACRNQQAINRNLVELGSFGHCEESNTICATRMSAIKLQRIQQAQKPNNRRPTVMRVKIIIKK